MSILTVVQTSDGETYPWVGIYATLQDVETAIREDMESLLEDEEFHLTGVKNDGENQWYCAVVWSTGQNTETQVEFYITKHD